MYSNFFEEQGCYEKKQKYKNLNIYPLQTIRENFFYLRHTTFKLLYFKTNIEDFLS